MLVVPFHGSTDLLPPMSAPPAAVADAVADELWRHGCVVRRVTPDAIEFDRPSSALGASAWGDRTAMVAGGVVWLGPASARRKMRLELRLSVVGLAWAPILALLAVAIDLALPLRIVALVGIAAMVWVSLDDARSQVEEWIAEGVRRA